MSRSWARDRAFSQAEAAEILEIPEATLRSWLASGAAPYASKKVGANRMLSAADCYILAIAKNLVVAGYSILVGTAEAWRVAGGPNADPQDVGLDHYVTGHAGGGQMGTVELVHEYDIAEASPEHGVVLIPAGRIARKITRAALEKYGTRVSEQEIAQVAGICAQRMGAA